MSEGLFGGWIGEKTATAAPGTDAHIHEQLIGIVNGINTVFTTSVDFVLNSEVVWFDGVRLQKNDDYTRSESGGLGTGYDTITFMDPPPARTAPRDNTIVSIQYTPE